MSNPEIIDGLDSSSQSADYLSEKLIDFLSDFLSDSKPSFIVGVAAKGTHFRSDKIVEYDSTTVQPFFQPTLCSLPATIAVANLPQSMSLASNESLVEFPSCLQSSWMNLSQPAILAANSVQSTSCVIDPFYWTEYRFAPVVDGSRMMAAGIISPPYHAWVVDLNVVSGANVPPFHSPQDPWSYSQVEPFYRTGLVSGGVNSPFCPSYPQYTASQSDPFFGHIDIETVDLLGRRKSFRHTFQRIVSLRHRKPSLKGLGRRLRAFLDSRIAKAKSALRPKELYTSHPKVAINLPLVC